jgi:myosin heavy subunit
LSCRRNTNFVLGIFDLLDDQTKIATGSIDHFMHGVEQNHKKHPNFAKDKKRRHAFVIKHYAGKVTYDVVNWIDKNIESTPTEVRTLINTSNNLLLQAIFVEALAGGIAPQRRPSMFGAPESGRPTRAPVTISAQFKKSLTALLDMLRSTNPFFIRCLKPNPEQS